MSEKTQYIGMDVFTSTLSIMEAGIGRTVSDRASGAKVTPTLPFLTSAYPRYAA